MAESYLYYSFETGEDGFVEIDSVLKLGENLKIARNSLREEFPNLINLFGVDLVPDYATSLSFRFWTVNIKNPCFYESAFKKTGYPSKADFPRDVSRLVSNLLTKKNVPFKESGFFRKKFEIYQGLIQPTS